MMKYAPMGDPMEIRLRGYELTLCRADAARIELVDVHDTDTVAAPSPHHESFAHPALGEGIDELVEHAVHVARFDERLGRLDFCAPDGPGGGAVHRCIHGIASLIEDHARASHIPVRFAATKLVEGDELVISALHLDKNELDGIEHIISQMEEESGTDRLSALADMRFSFIEGGVPGLRDQAAREPRAPALGGDRPRAHRSLHGHPDVPAHHGGGLLAYVRRRGAPLQGLMEQLVGAGVSAIDDAIAAFGTNPVVKSLVVDGVLAGVGSVLSFLPIIVVLFLLLSILEDSGYMARVAFVMDKVLRRFGLSGRSFVPMLVGFGCSVPAIMSTRTLPSEHDRKMTVMLTPFMSCSAKLPVYGLLCAAFFPQATVPAIVSLYVLGIVAGMVVALVLRRTAFKGEPVPFIMELPTTSCRGSRPRSCLRGTRPRGL